MKKPKFSPPFDTMYQIHVEVPVTWADMKGEVQDYEKEKVNFALYTRG